MILISYVSPFFKIGGISGYFRLIWKHSVPQRNVKYVFKRSNEAIKVISCKLKFISAYPAPSFFAMEKRLIVVHQLINIHLSEISIVIRTTQIRFKSHR